MVKSSFQFSSPSITDVHFSKNTAFKSTDNVTMRNSFGVKILRNKDNSAIVELAIMINEEEKEAAPFHLVLKASASFSWGEDIKKPDTFLQQNAPALLLSYARPFISNIVVSAGLPPYYIPFIDFTRDKK